MDRTIETKCCRHGYDTDRVALMIYMMIMILARPYKADTAYSVGCLCASHINQSDRVVLFLLAGSMQGSVETHGKRPMAFSFQTPTASASSWQATYTSFVCTMAPELF